MATIKMLCTRCLAPITQDWPDRMVFAGVECSAQEYVAQALRSESVYIVCEKCLNEMPDVRLEDLNIL